MAHHASARKRIRTSARRRQVNRMRISRIRTLVRAARRAVDTGDHTGALQAFRVAEREIRRGVGKGVVRKGTASRQISRLNARVRALA